MFGVVLWSDPESGSAVIWSEDCGDLAYYDASLGHKSVEPAASQAMLDTGDLVEFDAHKERDRLVARNPLGITQSLGVVAHATPPLATGAELSCAGLTPGTVVDLQAHRQNQMLKSARDISRRG